VPLFSARWLDDQRFFFFSLRRRVMPFARRSPFLPKLFRTQGATPFSLLLPWGSPFLFSHFKGFFSTPFIFGPPRRKDTVPFPSSWAVVLGGMTAPHKNGDAATPLSQTVSIFSSLFLLLRVFFSPVVSSAGRMKKGSGVFPFFWVGA